jgi:RNA polymerase sigma-70 factor (ECF subfamily)
MRPLVSVSVESWARAADSKGVTPSWAGAAPFPETVAAAARGDERAFTQLWRWLHPSLTRYLQVVAPWEWEDVASEVWYSVARDLGSFSGDERAFRAWALTIARHRTIDAARRRARRVETVPITDVDRAGDGDASTPVTRHVELAEVMAVLQKLPPSQAEVLALRVVGGLTVAEAAEALGKSEGAVRVLSHRGLRHLAEVSRTAFSAPSSAEDPGAASSAPASAPGPGAASSAPASARDPRAGASGPSGDQVPGAGSRAPSRAEAGRP